jgi:hypothetical protein
MDRVFQFDRGLPTWRYQLHEFCFVLQWAMERFRRFGFCDPVVHITSKQCKCPCLEWTKTISRLMPEGSLA